MTCFKYSRSNEYSYEVDLFEGSRIRYSLCPVVNILAIFSNANILKNKRIKYTTSKVSVVRYSFRLILSFLTKERSNKKEEKNDQTGTQAIFGTTLVDYLHVQADKLTIVFTS